MRKSSPWNRNRAIGQMRPFPKTAIRRVLAGLRATGRERDLALFCLGIDSMLRGSDLLRLRVGDVLDGAGEPRDELVWAQRKTDAPVIIVITPVTRQALRRLCAGRGRGEYYFIPARGDGSVPLSTNAFRLIVKECARIAGLDPARFSGHSLRRTKPALLWQSGVRVEYLRLLLGHKSLQSTQEYLGLDRAEALDFARRFDVFEGGER